MLYVNFKAYNSYVTDSLYQWDINQKLNIVGLNLESAPEVHFANANMERAIVRQATINKDTITVSIPNSILQEPLPIKAYIGIYEGETFKIIESIRIPVIPKERPTDYKFVDDGGDIYSYNEILNKMISFENKYGDVDLNAIREYNAWVIDVIALKSSVGAIEGTLENCTRFVAGSYTGDDSLSRTINVGGSGNVLLLCSAKFINIITPIGAFYAQIVGSGSSASVTDKRAKFENGILTLDLTSDFLSYYNKLGDTYYYQVL